MSAARLMSSWWSKEKGGVTLEPCKKCARKQRRSRLYRGRLLAALFSEHSARQYGSDFYLLTKTGEVEVTCLGVIPTITGGQMCL